jgi:hypothetical protein
MSDFEDRFKNHSNSHLLKIIDSKGEYQPEAIGAANHILASRQLTEEEIQIAKAEIANEQREKDAQLQKKIKIKNELKDFGASVVETIDPLQTAPPSATKIIKVICLILGLLFLYNIYEESGFIKFMLTDIYAKWDIPTVVSLLPLVWVPVSIILFYKRKRIGWILLAIFISYSIINSSIAVYMAFTHQPTPLDNVFLPLSPVRSIALLIFFSGILWLICKPNTREVYGIEKREIVTTIATGMVLTALAVFSFM